MRKISNKVAQQQLTAAERPSLNQESLQPLQAHYQQYLQQQQQSIKFAASYSASNMSNHHLQSSADLSLSQSATSDANYTSKMIDSQRSSRVQTQKAVYPNAQSNLGTNRNESQQNQHSNTISNSASSKGTPSFQQNQKNRRGEGVAANFGATGFNGNASGPVINLPSTAKSGSSNYYHSKNGLQQNAKVKGKKTTTKENGNQRKAKNARGPTCQEFKISGAETVGQNNSSANQNFFQNTNQFSNLLQGDEEDDDNASCQFVISDGGLTLYQAKSMQAHHKKNNPSNMGASQNSSSVMNRNENSQSNHNVNKHLRFDSIQDSSSATNQQFLSLTSHHYQNLISGTSEDNDNEDILCRDSLYNQENIQHNNIQTRPSDVDQRRLTNGSYQQVAQQFENEKMRQLREMMSETPDLPQSTKKNQITLSNSLLECVDQYGNIEDQYSVLLESQGDFNEDLRNESSTKKQFISELNNPNSYLNTVSKEVRALGSIYQEGDMTNCNNYNIQQQLQYPISNYNDFQSQNQNYFNRQQQHDYSNHYNVEHLANLASNQNFVVCSPSANTDDDCQYTNSSALRSMDDRTASAFKNQLSSNDNKRAAQLIYTDDRKDGMSQDQEENSRHGTAYGCGKVRDRESDLSLLNQQKRKFQSSDDNGQSQNQQVRQDQYFSSSGKEQFTGDNADSGDEGQDDEDEEIESKLTLMFKTKDDRQMQRTNSSFINDSCDKRTLTGGFNQNPREERKFQYVTQTPNQQMQNDLYLQVLDSDSRDQIVNDTPQVMEMIDQSNFNLHTRRETLNGNNQLLGSQNSLKQQSPLMLGSKENKKRLQAQDDSKDARYLNFKDISPLVKSCNTFVIENNALQNESAIESNFLGKLSPPHLQTHTTSLIQQNAPHYPTQQSQQITITQAAFHNGAIHNQQNQFTNTLTNYATELGSTLNNPNSLSYYNQQQPTHLHPLNQFGNGASTELNANLSPSQLQLREQMLMTNKLSSQMVESPPPLNDLTPEKGIKDFNRYYLGSGMWPHKPVQGSLQGAIQEYSLMNSGIGDASLLSSKSNNNVANKMGEQLRRIENQMSSISKKMGGVQQQLDLQNRDANHNDRSMISQTYQSVDISNERLRQQQQSQRNHPLAMSGQFQNGAFNTQQQNYYPGVDANIVQKISSTLDHMNNRFHFKRQSEQVPSGTNHFLQMRASKEKANAPNTMVNNTVFNQSSLDDICNTNYMAAGIQDDTSSNNLANLQLTNELYYNNSHFNSIQNQVFGHINQQQLTARSSQNNPMNNHQAYNQQQQQLNSSLQNKSGFPQSNFTTNNKNTVNNSTVSAYNRSPNTTCSVPQPLKQNQSAVSRNGQQNQNANQIAMNSTTSHLNRQVNNQIRLSNVSDTNPINNSTSSNTHNNTHNNSILNSNPNTNPNSNYNTSNLVKQVTLNGFGLGTVNQRMNGTSATTNSMTITNGGPAYQTNQGMGIGTLGTLGVTGGGVGESQTFNTFENVIKGADPNYQHQSLNNHPLLGNFSETLQQMMQTNQSVNQQQPSYHQQVGHNDNHRRVIGEDGEECCQDCLFEREKRMVTQKAFERALGISLFLMEEIDKINLMEANTAKAQDRPSTLTQSTGANKNPQLHFSRQDLTNLLLDQTQYSQHTFTNYPPHSYQPHYNQHPNLNQTYTIPHNRNLSSSPVSDNLLTASGGAYQPLNSSNIQMNLNKNIQQQKGIQFHQQSQTRLGRSKSQSLMPGEFQAMQKSLQLPRGIGLLHAVNQISGNNAPNTRQAAQQPRLRVVEEECDEKVGGNRIFFDNFHQNQQQQNLTSYI